MAQVTRPRWPPCPYTYMVKKLQKSSTTEPEVLWSWNLACSIRDSSSTKIIWMLTYFTARSHWVAYTFEWGKLLKSHLMRICSKRLNWLNNCVNEKQKIPRGLSAHTMVLNTCIWLLFSNIFFCETAWQIKAKFHVEPPWEGGKKFYINGSGHMTKMIAMLIYGKNLKQNFNKSSPTDLIVLCS